MTPLFSKKTGFHAFIQVGLLAVMGVLVGAGVCLPLAGDDRDDPDKAAGDSDKGPRDNPGGAMTFDLLRQQNEQRFVPRHALLDAVKQLNAMRQQVGLQAKVAGVPVGLQVESKSLTPKVGGLTPGGWKWLGPGNIGGRTLVLLIHPKNPDILYAGTAGGGIWMTRNGGKHWEVLSDIVGMVAVPTLVVDPTNPDILYAGTGEAVGAYRIRGEGIFRSNDGGNTWKPLPNTATTDFDYVNRLAISADGKVLLAAAGAGAKKKGLFRKAGDAASWDHVLKLNEDDPKMTVVSGNVCRPF